MVHLLDIERGAGAVGAAGLGSHEPLAELLSQSAVTLHIQNLAHCAVDEKGSRRSQTALSQMTIPALNSLPPPPPVRVSAVLRLPPSPRPRS